MVHRALVAGANGIIGKALLEELATTPGWEAQGLSRSHGHIRADLTDALQTREALRSAECTHLFYAAYGPGGGLAEEDTRNSAMLRNLLDGLKHAGAPLRRVVLYQGAKVYGVHLGPVSTPFYEDENPRPIGPNFYFTQERELRARHAAGGPEWTILRPDVVVGDAAGNAMNIATVIGAYAAICAAEGRRSGFRAHARHMTGAWRRLRMPMRWHGQVCGRQRLMPRPGRRSTTSMRRSGGVGSGKLWPGISALWWGSPSRFP